MANEIKGCPFCGVDVSSDEYRHLESCYFETINRLEHRAQLTQKEQNEITEAWNRRASPEPLTDEQMCEIAKPFLSLMGDHWNFSEGIQSSEIENFARAIERAHGILEAGNE